MKTIANNSNGIIATNEAFNAVIISIIKNNKLMYGKQFDDFNSFSKYCKSNNITLDKNTKRTIKDRIIKYQNKIDI